MSRICILLVITAVFASGQIPKPGSGSGGGSGASTFDAIDSGTSTSKTLVVGNGSVLVPTGTGKIGATDVLTGSGAPAAGDCNAAGEVGRVYINSDATSSQKKYHVCFDTGGGTYAWIAWQDNMGINSAHGGGTEVARGTVGSEAAIANGDSWVYSTDAGINRWTNRALKAVLRTHATDCTALTDGVDGQACYEKDSDRIFVCEPTAGGCDTAGEWILASGAGGSSSMTVNSQTGTTYTYLDGDNTKLVSHSNASAIAGTLPNAAGAGFDAGWWMEVQNRGAGTLTITPTTSTIDGAASLVLRSDQGVRIVSDGTNYFTQRGIGWTVVNGAGIIVTSSGNIYTVELDTSATNGLYARRDSGTTYAAGTQDFTLATMIMQKVAGGNPTTDGNCLWDSTNKRWKCGNGTTTLEYADLTTAQTLTAKNLTTPVIGSYTVAGLPAAGTANRVAIVTDAATAGSCTSGGGSARSWCRDTGAAWEPLGDGGGSGAAVGAQYLQLATDATNTAERVFTPGLNMQATDAGANGAYTLNHDPTDVRMVVLREEFGSSDNASGNVGSLAFKFTQIGSGAAAHRTGVWPNLGIHRISTGASDNDEFNLYYGGESTPALGNLFDNTNKVWTLVWVFKLVATTNIQARVGLMDDGLYNESADGCSIRFDSTADTNFMFECAHTNRGTITTFDSGVAADTNWHTIRIYGDGITNAKVWFQLDNGTARSFCAASCDATHTPAVMALTPRASVKTATTAAAELDLDAMIFKAAVSTNANDRNP